MPDSLLRGYVSDNAAGASPQILAAVVAAAEGLASPYGQDPHSLALREKLAEVFERPVDVFPVGTGSAANGLALAALTPPWGSILAHRLNNSNSLLEINPSLISGYLIKRSGTHIDDAPIVIEVNIVHSEVAGNPRTFHESLLREILGYYRGLGTIARLRGLVDPVRDARPWHIAAAEKAVRALYMLM